MRETIRWLSAAALAGLLLLPAAAGVPIRLLDGAGNMLTGGVLRILRADGTAERHPPVADGSYHLDLAPGEKVELRYGDPSQEFRPLFLSIPLALEGALDLIVVPQGPPPNDRCQEALAASFPGVTSGTTVGATLDPGALTCDIPVTSPGVWYEITGNGNLVTATTCYNDADGGGSADFDTRLTVYCPLCDGFGPLCVAGNDDSPNCGFPDFLSTVTWCADEGARYQILVHGFGESTGNFELELTEGASCVSNQLCSLPSCSCGDGIVSVICHEECDPPNGTTCNGACRLIPQGACCSIDCADPCAESCSITSQAQCAAAGADYLGDGTSCFELAPERVEYVDVAREVIPDIIESMPVVRTITISEPTLIADLDVGVFISHSWIGDLIVNVENPAGVAIPLWFQACNGSQYQGLATEFDDEGTAQFCNPAGPTPARGDGNGNIPPLGGIPLSIYDGTDARGSWTFTVRDNFFNDTGSLDQWSLNILVAEPSCTSCVSLPQPEPAADETDELDGETDVAEPSIQGSGPHAADGLIRFRHRPAVD